MKKIALVAACALMVLGACNNSKTKDAEAENVELKGDLKETLATQDSLFALLNDITDGMSQIKEMEKIVSTPGGLGQETASRKEQIRNDMMALQQALQERRERLDNLEKRLKASGNENSNLTKTIQSLRAQIADQETEIATLTNQLAEANIKIEQLGTQVTTLNKSVDSLNTNLDTEKKSRELAELETQKAQNELNECFYAIGSKSELKKQKILETGFLRKTKLLKGQFNNDYFTLGDKRTLTTIPLHSKKAKVLTGQPENTYEIYTDSNGQKILRITNPTKFWQMTNYLVVQID